MIEDRVKLKADELVEQYRDILHTKIVKDPRIITEIATECALVNTTNTVVVLEFAVIQDPYNTKLIDRLDFWDKVEAELFSRL